ncbi:MAG: hypothetical protein QGG64_17310 [Candidatus Latescibacteria bacterium]|jgi:chromosome segregation ATPase|nr:hypothetical protein [Candidatus Latescibacterota bacterium]
MAQIFLGVIIVGLIMTMKVVMDSLRIMRDINAEINQFRTSTQTCRAQIEIEEKQSAELALEVSQIQAEVNELTQKEKDMNKQIGQLRNDLGNGPKFKVDM